MPAVLRRIAAVAGAVALGSSLALAAQPALAVQLGRSLVETVGTSSDRP